MPRERLTDAWKGRLTGETGGKVTSKPGVSAQRYRTQDQSQTNAHQPLRRAPWNHGVITGLLHRSDAQTECRPRK